MALTRTPILDGNLKTLADDIDRLANLESAMYSVGLGSRRITDELTELGLTPNHTDTVADAGAQHWRAIGEIRTALRNLETIHADLTNLRDLANKTGATR